MSDPQSVCSLQQMAMNNQLKEIIIGVQQVFVAFLQFYLPLDSHIKQGSEKKHFDITFLYATHFLALPQSVSSVFIGNLCFSGTNNKTNRTSKQAIMQHKSLIK